MFDAKLLDRSYTQVRNSECPDHIKAAIIVTHYKSLTHLVQSLSEILESRARFGANEQVDALINHLMGMINECSIKDFGKKLIEDEIKD